jgi:hypothetical protein
LLLFNHKRLHFVSCFQRQENRAGVSPAQRPFVELFLFICSFSSDHMMVPRPFAENGRFVGHGFADLVEKARQLSLFRFLGPWLERSADRYATKIIDATAASNTL